MQAQAAALPEIDSFEDFRRTERGGVGGSGGGGVGLASGSGSGRNKDGSGSSSTGVGGSKPKESAGVLPAK